MKVKRTATLGIMTVLVVAVLAATRSAPPASTSVAACAAASIETLEGFSKCSLPDRKAAYHGLPLTVRRDLWREHLQSFLAPEFALEQPQRSKLEFIISRLDSYVVLRADTALARSARAQDGLSAKVAMALFGDSLARAMFAILGPDQRIDGHTVGEAPVIAGSPPPKVVPYCNCHIQSDFCCHGSCGNPLGCISVPDECGWFWTEDCNGICSAASESSRERQSMAPRKN